MQKVNPAIGSAGIHNNFLGQTLIQPDFTALHHDEIITVKTLKYVRPHKSFFEKISQRKSFPFCSKYVMLYYPLGNSNLMHSRNKGGPACL